VGDHVASVSLDQTLRLWNLENGKEMSSFAGDTGLFSCAVAPDGRSGLQVLSPLRSMCFSCTRVARTPPSLKF
jgi:WD40 repeat protein